MDVLPLATCIVPTADRRSLVPEAVRCFLLQDWPDKELVVVDDGADAIGGVLPCDWD
jgi:glycosyltransferase involved in cell wall biosynthesis